MKIAIYFSGILGTMLLLITLLGISPDTPLNKTTLIIGSALLLFVFLPLNTIYRYRQKRKIDKIIESYKGKEKKDPELKKGESKAKGWSMNSSPFRERRSGLTWGGGNIHAAGAKRGTRRSKRF